jgi:hypothetical protein
MEYPEFYILGAPRSGTRTLSNWLAQRGDITLEAMNPPSFQSEPDSGSSEQHGLPQEKTTHLLNTASTPGHTAWICEWQLYLNTSIPEIAKRKPEARFVVCLHDPAEVAWALHSSFLTGNIEHVRNFETAWALGRARQSGRGAKLTDHPELLDYASICSFGRQVSRLLTHVPVDRVHFVFLEDLRSKPAETWRSIEAFLDLPHTSRTTWTITDFSVRHPASFATRSTQLLHKLKNRVFPWQTTGNGADTYKNGITRRAGVLKPVPQDTRQKVSDLLSEDIAALSVLANRDLTHWIS